ncbi:MAG: RHS repeat-associated core domain-containing protein, partial [Myxococcota bacterium]
GSLSWQARVVATRYLADGRIESQTSASGIETVYTYYPSGPGNDSERLWKVTEDGVWLREFGGYDASGRATRSRDVESDVLTTTVFDPDGRVLSTVVTDGSVARSTFYDYDSAGRQIRTRSTATGLGYELINETEIFAGLPGITDPRSPDFCETQNGASDVAAAQAECIEALGYLDADVATLSGVGVGALDHLDSRADMQLNPDGTIAGSSTLNASNAIERRTESVFDENGQQIRSLKYTDDPLSPSYVRESYLNGLGWIIRETDPRFADVAANHAANESRANTETRYDRLGRAKSVTVALGTPDEATTTYSYDAHGNIASVTDANGNQTRYVYDDFDSLVLVESPDTGVTRYRYDAESRLVEKLTADGARSTYTYDNRGRTLSELFDVDDGPHAVDRYFFYDTFGGSPATLGATCASTGEVFDPSNTQGRLAWVQHGAGVTYYSYDPFGATTAVFEQVESTFDVCTLRIVRYGYDSLGRKILMTYPSGREIRWIYGANSAHPVRLELVEPGETPVVLMDQLAFDSAGSFIGYAAGSVSFGAEFDLSGQFVVRDYATTSGQDFLWTIDVDGSGMVEADERDGDGNPLQVGDAARAKTLDLSYDGQSRLTSSAGENLRGYQDCEWVYDGVGNRVGETCYGKQVSYEIAPDGNALLSTTYATNALACNDPNETVTQARTRDVLGRQTNGFNGRFGDAIEDFVLEYGADTRLSRATVAGATYDYVYDHRMLRWRTTAGGTASGVRDTVYGTSGSLLSETKYSGETHEYVWLGSTPVALIVDTDGSGTSPAAAMILGVDHLGTPHRAWDSSTGAPTWAGDYEAFGACTAWLPGGGTPSVEVSLRFPGQLEDAETGLHYNWWRFYVPHLGVFASVDPALVSGGDASDYVYSRSSPLANVDPSGLVSASSAECAAIKALALWREESINTRREIGGYVQRLGPKRFETGGLTFGSPNRRRASIAVPSGPDKVALWHTHFDRQGDPSGEGDVIGLRDRNRSKLPNLNVGYVVSPTGFFVYRDTDPPEGGRRVSNATIRRCRNSSGGC